jgi:hypothetical protein
MTGFIAKIPYFGGVEGLSDEYGFMGWHKDKGPVPIDQATVFSTIEEAKLHAPKLKGAKIEALGKSGTSLQWRDGDWC